MLNRNLLQNGNTSASIQYAGNPCILKLLSVQHFAEWANHSRGARSALMMSLNKTIIPNTIGVNAPDFTKFGKVPTCWFQGTYAHLQHPCNLSLKFEQNPHKTMDFSCSDFPNNCNFLQFNTLQNEPTTPEVQGLPWWWCPSPSQPQSNWGLTVAVILCTTACATEWAHGGVLLHFLKFKKVPTCWFQVTYANLQHPCLSPRSYTMYISFTASSVYCGNSSHCQQSW